MPVTSLQNDQTVAMAYDSGMISFCQYEDLLIVKEFEVDELEQ
jgi:hypothetical protein